jgi:RecJ-like exonuclease
MTCPECHGTGTTTVRKLSRHLLPPRPCPECNGTGIASCCDTAGSATGDQQPKLHPLLFGEPRPASVVNRDRPWPTYAPVNP